MGYREKFERTERLIGSTGLGILKGKRVAIFGIGGVGGHAAEAIVRAGVGHIDVIDGDVVSESNINRQIIALDSTIGMPKVEAAAKRFSDINPELDIRTHHIFFDSNSLEFINLKDYDYIVDAIDYVKSKLLLIESAFKAGIPIISSMGAGNKLDPTCVEVADIYKTSVCPLARVVRRELKKRGITGLKVVYSKEIPVKNSTKDFTKDFTKYFSKDSTKGFAEDFVKDSTKDFAKDFVKESVKTSLYCQSENLCISAEVSGNSAKSNDIVFESSDCREEENMSKIADCDKAIDSGKLKNGAMEKGSMENNELGNDKMENNGKTGNAVTSEFRPPVGSVSFVPSVFGLIMASEIIKDFLS